MRIVICGAGAIGASIARCLAERGAEPILVERAGIANAASGKSGGFLAYDWCDGSPLQQLARRSFDLHAQWAEASDDDWGYRRLDTFAGYPGAGGPNLPWLADEVRLHGRLGDPTTTAQVHPALFTQAMAHASGAEVVNGEVTGLLREGEAVRGVEVGPERIEGDAVVIAMGPWSILAARWLSLPAVYGLKGHSLVFRTGDTVPPQSLFARSTIGTISTVCEIWAAVANSGEARPAMASAVTTPSVHRLILVFERTGDSFVETGPREGSGTRRRGGGRESRLRAQRWCGAAFLPGRNSRSCRERVGDRQPVRVSGRASGKSGPCR